MTDYLEEAKSYVNFEGEDEDTWSEQVNAIRPIALTLIALVERLDATAQDIFGKDGESVEQIDALWERFKLAEHGHIMNRDRLDEIERKCQASALATEKGAVDTRQRLAGIEGGIGGRLRRLANRVSDLEAPDAPRVGEPESQSALREKLAKVMRESRDLTGEHPCYLTVGLYGDEMISQEITLGDLRKMILAMTIKSVGAEAQPALWKKLEDANADVERLRRQIVRDDERMSEGGRYAKKLEDKLTNILNLLKKNLPLDELEKAILEATY